MSRHPLSRKAVTPLVEQTLLVEGLRQRQEWAFVYLYDHYAPKLLGLLTYMVKHQPQAEDLLQECFIKVYKAIGQYDATKGCFSTWLLRITRNMALDYIHNQRVRGQCIDLADYLPTLEQTYFTTPPGDHASLQQLIQAHLGTKYWIIIELIFFEGYTQEEVAQLLQLPLGTVKTRSRTALQRLKTCLGKEELIKNQTC